MSVTNDLLAINAALKMGDCFLPPRGAIVKARWGIAGQFGYFMVANYAPWSKYGWVHLDSKAIVGQRVITYQWAPRLWCLAETEKSTFGPEAIVEVIWLPSDAPPFGDWERD